jgi:hypothetical protein
MSVIKKYVHFTCSRDMLLLYIKQPNLEENFIIRKHLLNFNKKDESDTFYFL